MKGLFSDTQEARHSIDAHNRREATFDSSDQFFSSALSHCLIARSKASLNLSKNFNFCNGRSVEIRPSANRKGADRSNRGRSRRWPRRRRRNLHNRCGLPFMYSLPVLAVALFGSS
jgi:hypothetical protein